MVQYIINRNEATNNKHLEVILSGLGGFILASVLSKKNHLMSHSMRNLKLQRYVARLAGLNK